MDIKLAWDASNAVGDWQFAKGDLVAGTGIEDLETAVLVSLFTDKLAPPDFRLTDGSQDRRGWWASSYDTTALGSWLWLLERAKISDRNAILLRAKDYCQDSLQWLLDLGIADTVGVRTFWLASEALGIELTITQPSQSKSISLTYQWAWY